MMKYLFVYSGRFHPFHTGHLSVYRYLCEKFGEERVYIASSDSQSLVTSPFSFRDKKIMMRLSGIPNDKIIKTTNPYGVPELTKDYDPANTVLIFAISFKDRDRFPIYKKDGTLSYIQPLRSFKTAKPFGTHAYTIIVPTVDFEIAGETVNSATSLRNMYVGASDKKRNQILKDLYGNTLMRGTFDSKLSLKEHFSILLHAKKQNLIENTPYSSFILKRAIEKELLENGVGRITKQNQTSDVGPNEIQKQSAKFGNKVDRNGYPPLVRSHKNKTHVLHNIGLAEGQNNDITIGDIAEVKVGLEDADFWIWRRTSIKNVGKPTKNYNPEHIGIKVVNTDVVLPDYLFFMIYYLYAKEEFQKIASGTLQLVSIKTSDIKRIKLSRK